MDKSKRDRPVVHTNDTGGIWIDAKELFTTEAGRKAIRQMIGSSAEGGATKSKASGRNRQSR